MRGFIFCENAQTTLTCSVVTLTCLVAISSHLSEVNPEQFGIIAHPTSDQLKACSCARSGTSGSSLAFPTLTVARAMLLQAAVRRDNCSSFQTVLITSHFHPQALSSFFRNFHWKTTRFHEPHCGSLSLD